WVASAGLGPPKPQQGEGGRFSSVDDLVARTGLRRDELVTLADIGALNAFGYDRRSALWQAERAIRPAGELFTTTINTETTELTENDSACGLASEASGPARGGGAPRGLKNVGHSFESSIGSEEEFW